MEEVAIKAVNRVGVEVANIKDHHHLSHTVQFVSGFGPFTAA